jgi:hypothetical protein
VNDATPQPTKDPLALGLGSLASGVGFGGACMTAAQIFLALNQQRFEVLGYYTLTAGLITAVGVGGTCGWYRSFSLENIWQRGVIAVLAAVGAVLIGFFAALLDRFFGVLGMIVWLGLTVAFGIVGTRWAIRGKGEEESGSGTA